MIIIQKNFSLIKYTTWLCIWVRVSEFSSPFWFSESCSEVSLAPESFLLNPSSDCKLSAKAATTMAGFNNYLIADSGLWESSFCPLFSISGSDSITVHSADLWVVERSAVCSAGMGCGEDSISDSSSDSEPSRCFFSVWSSSSGDDAGCFLPVLMFPMFCRIGVSLPHANGPKEFETGTEKSTDFVVPNDRTTYRFLDPLPR